MTNYCFIHLEFGREQRERSLVVIEKFKSALYRPGDRITLVIVDNARSNRDEPLQRRGFEAGLDMAGDNSTREFSGWDKGVARVLDSGITPDVWIFTNDTLALRHGWSDQRAARFGQQIQHLSSHSAPWLLGEIKDFPQSTMTPLGPLLENVATYCFAMNRELRDALGTLNPGEDFLDDHVYDRFVPDQGIYRDNVDPGYVDWTTTWLIKDQSEHDRQRKLHKFKWAYEWHNAVPLNARTFADLRMKARCCLAETVLTARARKLGADIRSPYEAQNARDRIRTTLHFLVDKLWEKHLMRKLKNEQDVQSARYARARQRHSHASSIQSNS